MKRFLLASLLFVVLGVVINVCVAWCSALSVDPYLHDGNSRVGFSTPQDPGWDVRVKELFATTSIRRRPIPRAQAAQLDDVIPYWSLASTPPSPDDVVNSAAWEAQIEVFGDPMLYEEARGWPMRSLVCYPEVAINNSAPSGGAFTVRARSAFAVAGIRDSLGMPRLLPVRPILLGFVINTAVYSVLLGLAVSAVAVARQRWRRARGRCPSCGHPMGLATSCTECGRGLPIRPVG